MLSKSLREKLKEALIIAEANKGTQDFISIGDFSEAKFNDKERTAEVVVIRKGWSKNNFYYTTPALEDIAQHINNTAGKVYLNHNPRSAIFEPRKEEDHIADNIIAKVSEDGNTVVATAKFFKSGPHAWIHERMKETNSLGPSIVGKAKIKNGEVDGRKGPIVEAVPYLHSYDIVSGPSAGGKVLSVSEGENAEYLDFELNLEEGFYLKKDLDIDENIGDVPKRLQPKILKDKMKQKQMRRESQDEYYNLEWSFSSEMSGIVLASGDYEYMSIADRSALVAPLIEEFTKEVNKIKFVEPVKIPTATREQIQEAEYVEEDERIKIILNKEDTFEKNTFKKVTILKENGITATVGKRKNSKLSLEVKSYQFDTDKGWNKELVKQWMNDNVKTETSINIKEGDELMFKNLAELKSENLDLYNQVIAEAKTSEEAEAEVKGWKDDSDKLAEANTTISEATKNQATLQSEKDVVEADNKKLKKENDKFLSEQVKVRKTTLIAEVKKEVGLAEEFCSESFNTILESIEFVSEKETEFKDAVKVIVEDRKDIMSDNPDEKKKGVIEGAGVRPQKKTDENTSTVLETKKFAAQLKKI